jgi:hypothetical protein
MASSVLLLLALITAIVAFVNNTCRKEYFPQVLDNINGVESRWNVGLVDDVNTDTLYLAGFIGDAPFVANYETNNMRYAWLHGLQTIEGTAV